MEEQRLDPPFHLVENADGFFLSSEQIDKTLLLLKSKTWKDGQTVYK